MNLLFFLLLALPLMAGFSPIATPTDKGNAAYQAGKYDDALDAYQKAAEDNPDKAEAHYNLGAAYFKKGEFDHALKEYDEAVKLDPKMADAYYGAGDALYRLGKYDEALKAFNKAESLYKKDTDTEHNIKLTLKKVKEEKEKEKSRQESQKGTEGRGKEGSGKGGRGQQSAGQSAGQPSGQGGQGQPQMSNDEVQALLDRQRQEENSLRNYFRPGKKPKSDRQAQIEQILRSIGGAAPSGHEARPGAPYVEKDW